jgi:hypothetical protein
MTIRELIEKLEEIENDLGTDIEVRLMTQENWPFENTIHGVTTSIDMIQPIGDEDEEFEEPSCDETVEKVVYIVEGSQLGYGSKLAWQTC